jgi:hypothetical protein
VGSSYRFYIRAGGVETEQDIPRNLHEDYGLSRELLAHDRGAVDGVCDSFGAAYWLGAIDDEGLAQGSGPEPRNPLDNPVADRTIYPTTYAVYDHDRSPGLDGPTDHRVIAQLPHGGSPLYTTSSCTQDHQGRSAGDVANVGGPPGVHLAGSITQAHVDKRTGAFLADSRAWVTGLSGPLDTISSVMQITALPGRMPLVSYRLSFLDTSTEVEPNQPPQAHFPDSKDGFTVAGQDVPADRLTDQFNQQVAANAAAIAAIGPLGFTLLAPHYSKTGADWDSDVGAPYIVAPAIQGELGLTARKGTIGQDQYVRFASIEFAG